MQGVLGGSPRKQLAAFGLSEGVDAVVVVIVIVVGGGGGEGGGGVVEVVVVVGVARAVEEDRD